MINWVDMTITKECKNCKQTKSLDSFFIAPNDAAASWHGSSMYCIACHDAGLIKYGYGYYGDKYKKPDWCEENIK